MAEQQQLMADVADDLDEMVRRGWVACRVCGFRFYGNNLGDMLQQLGEHGEGGCFARATDGGDDEV